MPTKVLFDAKAFGAFAFAMRKRGYREFSRNESKRDHWRLELEAPSPREGREVGFVYTANGLTAVVWTSYDRSLGRARDTDSGWVLIKEGDHRKYVARPMRRTKNFLHTLLTYAAIARLRVQNRPLCPICQAHMSIVNGKGFKSRYWQCTKPEFHKRPTRLPWDVGLPSEAIKFLQTERRARARYRKKLLEQGKSPGSALKSRIGWKIGRPDNMVRV